MLTPSPKHAHTCSTMDKHVTWLNNLDKDAKWVVVG